MALLSVVQYDFLWQESLAGVKIEHKILDLKLVTYDF
jgi:hypothetical protein